MPLDPEKTAIVHDWIDAHGGAEAVVECIYDELRPTEFYTLMANPNSRLTQKLGRFLKTSYLQKLPFSFQLHRYLLQFYPAAIESFDLRDAQLIVSSSHCVAKGVITRSDQLHISYVHTPARYLWDQTFDYLHTSRRWSFKNWYMRTTFSKLRQWDQLSANRVSLFLANSLNVSRRIWHNYRRPSIVLYPFVDLEKFTRPEDCKTQNYFVVLSRLVSQKRIDVVVEAFKRLDIPLKIIGHGPLLQTLKNSAGPRTEFLGALATEELILTLSQARGLIFPTDEDFGIVPIEAQALGVPVLAFDRGGARETVIQNKTGDFFKEQTSESLVSAMRDWKPENYDRLAIQKNAQRFSKDQFKERLNKIVELSLKDFQSSFRFNDHAFTDQFNSNYPLE